MNDTEERESLSEKRRETNVDFLKWDVFSSGWFKASVSPTLKY